MADHEVETSPLIAAAERADRRNLSVIGVLAPLGIAAFLIWGANGGASEDVSADVQPLSARIELASTTVTQGGTIDGRVVVTNNTGEDIRAIGCGSLFQVALANADYEPTPAWTLCAREFTIPTGESTYPVTVRAHRLGCSADPSADDSLVRCEPNGDLPALPPGDYEATLYQGYEGRPIPEPATVAVQVVPDQ